MTKMKTTPRDRLVVTLKMMYDAESGSLTWHLSLPDGTGVGSDDYNVSKQGKSHRVDAI